METYGQDLDDLPPSAKFVYKMLQYEGEQLTQKELIELTSLPDRTVRYALQLLVKKDIIDKRKSLRDIRQDLYSLKF
ncbi:MAG: MarR family transcriptional regulator [DPANN group archaeon]|nr:MarR family transcriptional regulator [DPANN group archaeon]